MAMTPTMPQVALIAYVYECQRCGMQMTVKANVGNQRYGSLHLCKGGRV